MKFAFSLFTLLATLCRGQDTLGLDYIDEVPPTIYEAETVSPQNADFDAENNMFIAHECWYNDYLIHYYKFRIYAPDTYPETISGTSTAADVPIQPIYFVTTTGDMTGVVGNGIIPYHTSDGDMYSDFMEIYFVQAPEGYVADTFKSVGDITNFVSTAEINIMASGIILNIPIVPTGATLQDPHERGTTTAPISPTIVWYKGNEVTTYVFEVTDDSAAEYFADTREDPTDPAYSITVTAFGGSGNVRSIPFWFFNPFSRGVTVGVNNGGPNPLGMRNVINLDRPDPGYSPLWQLFWITELPINYTADDVSNFAAITTTNGFDTFEAPMYVNCPNIGKVGTEKNVGEETFTIMVDTKKDDTSYILGNHMDLIFQNDVTVSFLAGDVEIGSTKTNPLGAYEYALASADIPQGTSEITVMAKGMKIRTIAVNLSEDDNVTNGTARPKDLENDTSSATLTNIMFGGLSVASLVAVML